MKRFEYNSDNMSDANKHTSVGIVGIDMAGGELVLCNRIKMKYFLIPVIIPIIL